LYTLSDFFALVAMCSASFILISGSPGSDDPTTAHSSSVLSPGAFEFHLRSDWHAV
jgi:hypothetical protein